MKQKTPTGTVNFLFMMPYIEKELTKSDEITTRIRRVSRSTFGIS
jgi:hypothetical protein